jgi:hypothetical protein
MGYEELRRYNFPDLDGDGMPDVFWFGSTIAKMNTAKVPDLLKKVTQPTGGTSNVTYKSSAQYKDVSGNQLNPKLPLTLQTVASVSSYDGNGVTSTVSYTCHYIRPDWKLK